MFLKKSVQVNEGLQAIAETGEDPYNFIIDCLLGWSVGLR